MPSVASRRLMSSEGMVTIGGMRRDPSGLVSTDSIANRPFNDRLRDQVASENVHTHMYIYIYTVINDKPTTKTSSLRKS